MQWYSSLTKLVPIIITIIIKINYFTQSKYFEKFFFDKQNKLFTLEQKTNKQ